MNSKVSLKPEFQNSTDSNQESRPAQKLGGFFVGIFIGPTSTT